MFERPVIYIVDQDDVVLWLYQEFLRELGATFKVFKSAHEFLEAYSPGRGECLVCDMRMPELDGLAVQRELLASGALLPVVFVSAQPELDAVVAAIKAGAFDFLEKPVNGVVLRERVRSALEHSRKLHVQRIDGNARKARLALLTPKERAIADRVVVGMSSREISGELGISVRTVENHRARVSDKLHISSAVELARLLCG